MNLPQLLVWLRRIPKRWETILVIVAIIGAALTLVLGGTVRPQTIQVIDASKPASTPYGELTSGTTPGYSDNFAGWTTASNVQVVSTQSALTVSGTFQNTPTWSSIILFKSVNVNITAFPIVNISINVTQGVRYGVRFYSEYPNGTQYNVWWEGSTLDHRPGAGYEEIRLNMQRQALLATGRPVVTLTKLGIYVEAPPSTPQDFQLVLSKLVFANETVEDLAVNNYRAVYFNPGDIPQDNATWYLNKINLGVTVQAEPGTAFNIYFFNGPLFFGSTTATNIAYNSLTAFSEYTFYPNVQPQLFSELLPQSEASIVFMATSGQLKSVAVRYIDFIFLPNKQTASLSQQSLGLYYAYFIFFLFLLPLGLAILIFREFLPREIVARAPLATVLVTGLVCRAALAATTAHVFDMNVFLASTRTWFQYGSRLGTLGPTLPFTFFLYWVGYSPYALLQLAGFQDLEFLGHAAGVLESAFVKLFPMTMDVFTFLLLLRFRQGGRPFVWATFYFLNPLAIFTSAVWGQYEAATMTLIVWGIYWLSKDRIVSGGAAFVISGMVQLVGFIPYALLLIRTGRAKKFFTLLSLVSLLILVFVYFPEADLIFRLFMALSGFTRSQLSRPGIYSLPGSFPSLAPIISTVHPLLIAAVGILVAISYSTFKGAINIEKIVLYTGLSASSFLMFSSVLSWLWILPIGLLYAILSGKDDLGSFMLVFGTSIAFLLVSNTTGSSYLLLGEVGFAVQPVLESTKNRLLIFNIMTTTLAVLFLFYLRMGGNDAGQALIRSSSVVLSTYLLVYFWLGVYPI